MFVHFAAQIVAELDTRVTVIHCILFFGRARGELPWAPQHPDTAWGDNVPHISETRIRILADSVEQMAAQREPDWYRGKIIHIDIEGVSYHMGTVTGDECNCLIHTLLQTLPVCLLCGVCSRNVTAICRRRFSQATTCRLTCGTTLSTSCLLAMPSCTPSNAISLITTRLCAST